MGTCKNRGKPLLGRDPLWLHSLVEKEQSLEQPTKSNVDEGPAVCILHFQHVRGWTIRVVANKIYIHADTTLPSQKCRWRHKLVDVVVAKKCRPMSSIHNQLASPKHLKYITLQTIIIWNISVTYVKHVPKYKIYNNFLWWSWQVSHAGIFHQMTGAVEGDGDLGHLHQLVVRLRKQNTAKVANQNSYCRN